MSGLLSSLPESSSNEPRQSSSKIMIPSVIDIKTASEVDIKPKTELIKEEWPSLPDVSGRKKTRASPPSEETPGDAAPSTPSATQVSEIASQPVCAVSAKPLTTVPTCSEEQPADDHLKANIVDTALQTDKNPKAKKMTVDKAHLDQAGAERITAHRLPDAEAEVATASQATADVVEKLPSPNVVVPAVTRPLTPSVRLSPAPSGNPKMTIIVDNLSTKEPEDDIRARFRHYGRVVSLRSQAV